MRWPVPLFAVLVACASAPPRATGLPDAWQRVRSDGDGVVFHHRNGGTIARSTTCGDADDVPLDVLVNHELIGVDNRRERGRQALIVDGRAALRTRLDATMDGVPVALDLVVFKKDGCTVDLYMVAPIGSYDERRADFDEFLASAPWMARR